MLAEAQTGVLSWMGENVLAVVSLVCLACVLFIVVATIFNAKFRTDMLGDEKSKATVFGTMTVTGATVTVITLGLAALGVYGAQSVAQREKYQQELETKIEGLEVENSELAADVAYWRDVSPRAPEECIEEVTVKADTKEYDKGKVEPVSFKIVYGETTIGELEAGRDAIWSSDEDQEFTIDLTQKVPKDRKHGMVFVVDKTPCDGSGSGRQWDVAFDVDGRHATGTESIVTTPPIQLGGCYGVRERSFLFLDGNKELVDIRNPEAKQVQALGTTMMGLVRNGETMAPVGKFAEAMGIPAKSDPQKGLVLIEPKRMEVWVGTTHVGQGQILSNRVVVPLRQVTEALGGDIYANMEEGVVTASLPSDHRN